MKEYGPSITQNAEAAPVYPIPIKYRTGKQWKVAKRTNIGSAQRNQNALTEHYYHLVLLKVKELYTPLQVTAFEKDYRNDPTENAFTMHSFITPQFYWNLSCELTNAYQVSYDFYNFPFKTEIRMMIDRHFEYIQTAHHHPTQPNCEAFFNRVQKVQESKYFNLIKV